MLANHIRDSSFHFLYQEESLLVTYGLLAFAECWFLSSKYYVLCTCYFMFQVDFIFGCLFVYVVSIPYFYLVLTLLLTPWTLSHSVLFCTYFSCLWAYCLKCIRPITFISGSVAIVLRLLHWNRCHLQLVYEFTSLYYITLWLIVIRYCMKYLNILTIVAIII